MLDRVDAGSHRGFDPFRSFGVRHHFLARSMRHLNRLGHLLFAQLLDPIIADRIHHAAGGHQLDPVGAVLDIAPHRDAHRVNRVRDIRPPWQLLIWRQNVSIAVSPVYRNKVSRRNHARPADQSLLDAVAQSQLTVTEIVLSGIAERGESVVKPDLEIVHSPDRLLRR